MMSLAQAHALLPGSTLLGDGATRISRVHSDTRTLRAGDLFVALKGERFDAHDMLAGAKAKGAVAALAQRGLSAAGLPGLQVANTQQALVQIATAWRARLSLPLIAVTGSNGKTTVTQMIGAILRAWLGDAALATEGNYNNHIGVPLTVLRLRQDDQSWHRAAVVELGMNHPGEIALLAGIAQPTIALVNNAQREHQEFMAGVAAVARENGAVIEALGPAGTAVYPADDEHAPLWHRMAGARPQLCFALHGAADVTADMLWASDPLGEHWALVLHTPAGSTALALRMAGRHNVRNALAAAACALAAGAPLPAIKRGLEAFVAVKGRSQLQSAWLHGVRIALVDDSYNANPDSMRAAIDMLAQMHAPRLLVLGDMGEVGDHGAAFHAEVGAYARERGIDHLWCAGPQCVHAQHAFGQQGRHFAEVPALIAALAELPAAASVLVKGSRYMAMERVVQALMTTENA